MKKLNLWWDGNSMTNNGIISPKEKCILLLNIPEYWNRVVNIVEQQGYKGVCETEGTPPPYGVYNKEERQKRIQEVIRFAHTWRIPSQFIQPAVFGIVLYVFTVILNFAWNYSPVLVIFESTCFVIGFISWLNKQ